MGGGRRDGVREAWSAIMVTTAGLSFRWYAGRGVEFLRDYAGVFFDEVGDMDDDPEYALLWEAAWYQSKRSSLKLVVASATLSARMRDHFTLIGARCIVCHLRPFPVWCNVFVINMDQL